MCVAVLSRGGSYIPFVCNQPHSFGDGSTVSGRSVFPQMWQHCSVDVLCWRAPTKAAQSLDLLRQVFLWKEHLPDMVLLDAFGVLSGISPSAGSWRVGSTAKTTTSLSTVRMIIWWRACCAVCDTCSRIRVSTSSWLHGASVFSPQNCCMPHTGEIVPFHCFMEDCNTVSSFAEHDEKAWLSTCKSLPELTNALLMMANGPQEIPDHAINRKASESVIRNRNCGLSI